jgi:predicted RND superfamily exporter protein
MSMHDLGPERSRIMVLICVIMGVAVVAGVAIALLFVPERATVAIVVAFVAAAVSVGSGIFAINHTAQSHRTDDSQATRKDIEELHRKHEQIKQAVDQLQEAIERKKST